MPLKVMLLDCFSLKDADWFTGYSEAYVVFTVHGQSQTSSVIPDTTDPVWNPPEIFMFDSDTEASQKYDLTITVRDKDRMINEKIGKASVDYQSFPAGIEQDLTVDLGKKSMLSKKRSYVHIKITNLPRNFTPTLPVAPPVIVTQQPLVSSVPPQALKGIGKHHQHEGVPPSKQPLIATSAAPLEQPLQPQSEDLPPRPTTFSPERVAPSHTNVPVAEMPVLGSTSTGSPRRTGQVPTLANTLPSTEKPQSGGVKLDPKHPIQSAKSIFNAAAAHTYVGPSPAEGHRPHHYGSGGQEGSSVSTGEHPAPPVRSAHPST